MLWGAGLAVMVTVNLILVFVFHSEGAKNELGLHELIKAYPIAMGIIICLFGPFIEEIVFRKSLRDAFPNDLVFIVMSFLIFGSIHVTSTATNLIDWLYIIPYGALGAAFAGMYCKTKTIYTSITFHMLHNTILFILILLT
jgi:membrane protease YdiL (CAAX protease family)